MNDKDLRDVAATTQTFRRKEVQGDLNFIENLDALDAALEADNIVCRFNNPNGGAPIDFELRCMTPGEMAIYYQTLLGHTLLEAAGAIPRTESEDEQVQDELSVKKYDETLLAILEGCIQSPVGVTAERMRNWDPFYIMSLHNALMEGSRPSKQVAQFHAVDETTRE